ncbi:MAG: glycosyltransferase [Polyangiaceae bacterium]
MSTIVLTTSYPSFEGDPSGHFVRSEVDALRAESSESVQVLAPPSWVTAFGWPGAAARVRQNPLRLVGAAWWVAFVRRELKNRAPRRVVAHWAIPCGVAAASVPLEQTRVPFELELVSHGADVRFLRAMPASIRARLVGHLLARASRWRFVSEALRDALAGVLPPASKDALVAKSLIRAPLLQVDRPTDLPPRERDEKRLVWVGRLVPSKNLGRALEYVSCTQKDAHLVVVGDGPSRRALEREASSLGVRASFVGKVPRPKALAWIASADTLLMSSKAEGLSTVVREAEALGTPVLWV